MRFNAASSSLLLTHVLVPTAVAVNRPMENTNGVLTEDVTVPHPPFRSHPLMAPSSEPEEALTLSAASGATSSSGSEGGPLVNQTKNHFFDKRGQFRGLPVGSECDPDVGILSCGVCKICKTDDTSSMGGVCAPRPMMGTRNLFEDGKPRLLSSYDSCVSSDDEDLVCDCSNWDYTWGTGSASCTKDDACRSECGELCYDYTFSYSFDFDSLMHYVGCYQFTSPYRQKLCFGYTLGSGCYIKLNNKKCTSCDLSLFDLCGSWDCSNVNMGTGDFCENLPLAPIVLSECYGIDTTSGAGTSALELSTVACSTFLGVLAGIAAVQGW